ncbi:hypothetical protein MUK42_28678 [Musa troglodytarum]|uniref:Acyl carrier protein n=1 Tax=Musa troglodytarum TaxID=320322 RepID=A0A9E7JP73_9LILI|nr:hypothetical protein MUK42_28678 [Musa troglodytarum]
MAFYKRSRVARDAPPLRRVLPLVLVVLASVLFVVFMLKNRAVAGPSSFPFPNLENPAAILADPSFKLKLPKQTLLSVSLDQRNRLPPRNTDLFPTLAKDHTKIVLYVHNRPQYLRAVVRSLAGVEGIGETLLIVSHDGYFPEMDGIVRGIRFCQVKQIFAPYSPHLFPDSFPGVSLGDCHDKDDPAAKKCNGTADQYGNHRSPRIVSLKHHWWWMMNTVWDGMEETRGFDDHILFIEEDHYIYPNAYRNLQLLIGVKPTKCPECYATNLAPSDVKFKGEATDMLIAEKIGNMGYAFNRTIWRKIHAKAKEFCSFDEYNWDITMWATVYPSFGAPVYTLRGPRTSAAHFGKCGLHQGQGKSGACIDNGEASFQLDQIDKILNIKPDWQVLADFLSSTLHLAPLAEGSITLQIIPRMEFIGTAMQIVPLEFRPTRDRQYLFTSTMADEELVDPKKYLEDSCKPKCARPLHTYQACVRRIKGDVSGHKHCTGQYFDYFSCVDNCTTRIGVLVCAKFWGKMQHLRNSITKHVRLGCSTGLSEFGAAGRQLNSPCQRFCVSSSNTSMADLTARVLELVKKFDKLDASKVTEKADFQKDLCLDSLDRVELVMAIEQEFSVEIPDQKADKLSCCADVVKYISEAQAEKKAST